jgi:PAS domain S-box-containing protein
VTWFKRYEHPVNRLLKNDVLREERKLTHQMSGHSQQTTPESSELAEPQVHIQSYWRFRDLLEAAPDGILEVEHDGTIVLLNAAAERIFGYPREELLGQLIELLVPESFANRHQEHRRHYAEHPVTRPMGIGLELFARRKDGSQFPVEISLSPIRSPQGSRVIAIVRDITSRKQAEARINAMHQEFAAELAAKNEQLEIRRREAERANRLKSEFLASMSHELRTPLHTIIGFADLLAEELKGPLNSHQKRFVDHIRHDSRHLLELINDILDLSKIESGRIELHPELFCAADAVEETVAGLRPLAQNKQIRIDEAHDTSLMVTADRLRFKEILYNLISNAIKFTPEKGQITIESGEQPDYVLFAVADTGIGIDPSERQAIFDKFYQVGSTTRGVREGTGLGLAITKNLVEMHGGKVWVESVPGMGSRFLFTLPRVGIDAPAPKQTDNNATRKGPILLVGMQQNHHDVAEFLKQKGYRVVAVQSVQEGPQMRPAAIVLDLAASGGAQIGQCLSDLRTTSGSTLPVIALTSGPDENLISFLGATAVLTAPFDPQVLLKTLQGQISPVPGAPSRILVVGSETEVCDLVKATLRSAPLLPICVSSGKQAFEVLARGPVSAVVADISMPDMNAFDFVLRVRQNPCFGSLPIVMLVTKKENRNVEILGRQGNIVLLEASGDGLAQKIAELLEQLAKV